MNMPNAVRTALILVVLPLAGCLSGLQGEISPIQVVSPNVRIETDPSWPEVDLALNVRRPQANQMLDGFGLLVRQDRHRLLTYPGLAWADTTGDLLQAELIKGLLDSRRLTGGVGRPGEIRAHGTLISNIRHFELVDDGPDGRHIHLEVSAMLTRNRDARQVAGENFLVIRPVATTDAAAMLDAYEAAITELVQQMIGWTLNEAQAQKEKLEAVGLS
jgi:cholesterol transport system auxiliary component